MYLDTEGELQFLRRSILAGAHKYTDTVLKHKGSWDWMSHFSSHLLFVTRLIAIGYGFGDLHINWAVQKLDGTQCR